jgi:2,3-bisphosphoglycerate-independent phosphoglycerate mutase
VPFIFITDAPHGTVSLNSGGSLRDISPTILSLLHLDQPRDMTGENLLVSAVV